MLIKLNSGFIRKGKRSILVSIERSESGRQKKGSICGGGLGVGDEGGAGKWEY